MRNLCSISNDVQSLVWSHLCARDLVSIMLTCKAMNISISQDKQLWVGCAARQLPADNYLIPYRRSLENVDASDVRSWLGHGMSLHRSYSSFSPTIQKLDSIVPRIDTWVKLIRGRWCLVASSNVSESRLTLWDLSTRSGCCPHLCCEIFFPGPIMDGQIDDDRTTIRIAVTVGSSEPYIQIISVGRLYGNARFKMLGSVPGASHSLLLHGSEVVVALMNDDDAFPVVIEWTTEKIAVLGPVPLKDSARYHDLNPHLPCCAVKYWNEFIVLVMTSEVQIYKKPDFASHEHSPCGALISIHPIDLQCYGSPLTVDKAYFVDSEAMPMTLPYPPSQIDFDDGRGVFVVGNSRGELFVGRFVDDNLLSTSSVHDDLPNISDSNDIGRNKPVQMTLPVFYSYANIVRQGSIPLPLRKAATKLWGLVDGRPFTAPGWSSDWLRFRNIDRWIVPHLRWGAADPYFHFGDGGLTCFDGNQATSAVLRHDHRILGNIYPVAYREDDHTEVIFRVGQRYYFQAECNEYDRGELDIFELNIYVFAITHAVLKSPNSLQSNVFGRYDAARLLDTYYGSPDCATVCQETQIHEYDDILQETIFPTELESDRNPATCSVENGRIVIHEPEWVSPF
ncbi:hypothetical protein BD410DRAFT_829447 [Rickenella mellea]|uniref:F-box domain-containing protein n=1 Tax=Rickenella mellea TaxID=50990 RepID=A0A4Y7PZH7_9AGAM|nr:hypothetical protein BD410DRAFT_829447 [Rickenella mellea]